MYFVLCVVSRMLEDIFSVIISFCDLEYDYKNLLFVNKQYQILVDKNILFSQMKNSFIGTPIKFYDKSMCKKNANILLPIFFEACKHNHLLYVKYLVDNYKIKIHAMDDLAFRLCCKHNNLIIAKYLVQLELKTSHWAYEYREFNNALFQTCSNNYIDFTKYLFDLIIDNCAYLNNNKLQEIFAMCCHKNYFQISKHIIDYVLEIGIDLKLNLDLLLKICCSNGATDFMEYLVDLSILINVPINIDKNCHNLLVNKCKKNDILMVKHLVNLSHRTPYPIDIHKNNEYIFRLCCYHGHIKLAKYFINICDVAKNKINIHIDDEYCFRLACKNEHIRIVKFLIELGKSTNYKPINICAQNNYVFRLCRDKKYNKMSKYLEQLEIIKLKNQIKK